MKNPKIVKLFILDERLSEYHYYNLPLKEQGEYLIIQYNTFVIFVMNKIQSPEYEPEKLSFEFYDIKENKFVEYQKDDKDYYKFPKDFFGEPMILMIKLNYFIEYKSIQELDYYIEEFQQTYQKNKIELEKQIDARKYEYIEIKQEIKKIQNKNKTVDIVIFYSSALIQLDNGKKDNKFEQAKFIDYESEIQTIENEIRNNGKDLNYEIINATKKNFEEALLWNPQVLHFIMNGDCYVNNFNSYFEIEENGFVEKLSFEDELAKILDWHKKSLKRLKVICISSIIAQNEVFKKYNQYTIVGQIKIFDQEDKYGMEFWKSFYNQLIKEKNPIEDSYKIASSTVNKLFNKEQNQNPNNFTICCCYHQHINCQKNPQDYGYKQCHEQHLNKQIQHVNQYEQNNEQINQSLSLYSQVINDDVRQIQIGQNNQCCNCLNNNASQSIQKYNSKIKLNNNHDFSQKFLILNPKNQQLERKQDQIDQTTELEQTTEIHQLICNYIQINKQIIIINYSPNKNESLNDSELKSLIDSELKSLNETLKNYFDNYCKIKNINLDYHQENATELIEDFKSNVNKFLNKPDNNILKILNLANIDQQYQLKNEEFFKKFFKDLFDKFEDQKNLVIIFEISFKTLQLLQIDNKYEKFIQKLNYDIIKEELQSQG